MTDDFNFCLVRNNEAPVEEIHNVSAAGQMGDGGDRAQKVNMTFFENTKAKISNLGAINVVARDLRNVEPTQNKVGHSAGGPAKGSKTQSSDKTKSTSSNNFSYQKNFEELSQLGSGGFGAVFKARDKIDDQIYAVKKVVLKDSSPEIIDFVLREVRTLAKISGDRVVRYFNSWLEDNCLFIKMEFCSDNLKNIIQQKREVFQRTEAQEMDVIEYQISCQMLRELLECVRYLHELDPPIIHRDLKPLNVLISQKPINGNYLKLCDFGLAIVHDKDLMTHTEGVGTLKYMAPEISKGKYDLKADIYSLGRIAEELFDLDSDSSLSIKTLKTDLKEKFNNLTELILAMTKTPFYNLRPTCAQVMDVFESISFDKNEIKIRSEFVPEVIRLNNVGKQIFLDYLTK